MPSYRILPTTPFNLSMHTPKQENLPKPSPKLFSQIPQNFQSPYQSIYQPSPVDEEGSSNENNSFRKSKAGHTDQEAFCSKHPNFQLTPKIPFPKAD